MLRRWPILAVLLAGCAGAEPQVSYFVSYADAAAYDERVDGRRLDMCAALPGVERGGQDGSDPPSGITLRVSGAGRDRTRLEDCLRALPDVRVIGPAVEGEPSPPRLVG